MNTQVLDRKITSAFRLHSEVRRFRKRYSAAAKQTVAQTAPAVFSLDGKITVGKGMDLLGRLIRETHVDLLSLEDEDRKKKYRETLEQDVSALLDLRAMHMPGGEFVNNHLGPITLERLEGLNDWLIGIGRFSHPEAVRINAVVAELERLLQDIETSERTELDEFLVARLKELKLALENYSLFGPEGVVDCLRRVLGQAQIAHTLGNGVSAALVERSKTAAKFVIGAIGALTFLYGAAESVSWLSGVLAGEPVLPMVSEPNDRPALPSS